MAPIPSVRIGRSQLVSQKLKYALSFLALKTNTTTSTPPLSPSAAARMEQTGRPGYVHMTAKAALQLHSEGPAGAPRPPLHVTNVKSKGAMLTAW